MRSVLAALALFVASNLYAQERTLVWKALDVTARLENDGTLHVSERHRMRFDGDWNGGQRVFRVEPGQQLALLGMSRVDDGGGTHAMAEASGGGINLHEYLFDGQNLRWRAREASDPPFRNEERTYVVDYQLRNVIERRGEQYVLDHDFAFPDRPGAIESLSVKLELDSAWQAPPDFNPRFERSNVPPGESAILNVQLQWTGAGQPQYLAQPDSIPAPAVVNTPRPVVPATPPASMVSKLAALGGFAIAAMILMVLFLRREEALGRFEPRPEVTPAWIEEHLLVHRAEVVGAAWDGATGPGEVAALIAILTAEGKMENVPGAPRLRLLVPRESLSEYERGFVNALFIEGDEIDPETLRRHYRETGFRPEATIAATLSAAASKLVGKAPRVSWAFGCLAFVMAAVVFPIMAIAFAVTLALAVWYRNSLRSRGMATVIPIPLLIAAVLHAYINVSLGWLVANLIAGAVLLWIALRLGSWRGSELELRHLLHFRAARAFLQQRIVQRDPAVDMRWIPYMLAFGLVPDDRWSVAAANVPRRDLPFDDGRRDFNQLETRPSPARGDGGSASEFVAGGGAFGGAGSTGSWASIQTFASAVAATPVRSASSSSSSSSGSGWNWSSSGSSSSSSSRSSSSSSSSRSGGGGGGGW